MPPEKEEPAGAGLANLTGCEVMEPLKTARTGSDKTEVPSKARTEPKVWSQTEEEMEKKVSMNIGGSRRKVGTQKIENSAYWDTRYSEYMQAC